MSEARFQTPGFWTVAVHFVTVVALFAALLPLVVLRAAISPIAEILIRATDNLHDALAERLDL